MIQQTQLELDKIQRQQEEEEEQALLSMRRLNDEDGTVVFNPGSHGSSGEGKPEEGGGVQESESF